ncbi:DedA family protein [Garciella nitratireducens]|uniref:DedA family protein n=1 Tax=Garciella nitratireducens TaxID=218205 RepID=UPI000DE9296F|nr:DedA family protein [Garciella nitratireducens]RBP37419.1 membrane protein DedA with SNARE-associated domain [Garciella nitratireducens]
MIMNLLSLITNLIDQYGYIVIVITAFLEGASIPFPGSPILVLSGFLIYQGKIHLWLAVLLATTFYTIASIIPYSIGKKLKEKLFDFLEVYLKIPREKIDKIKAVFNQYGEISICLTRPFFIGNYISYFAGISQIPLIRFLPLTFIGIMPWSFLYLVLGYIFRGSVGKVDSFLDRYHIFGIWNFIGVGIFGVLIAFKWYKNKKAKDGES